MPISSIIRAMTRDGDTIDLVRPQSSDYEAWGNVFAILGNALHYEILPSVGMRRQAEKASI